MLKKNAMAAKVAKFMLSEVVKDSKDNALKEEVLKGLEKAYIAGYDLAIKELKTDNSKVGFEMAEFLEFLDESENNA